MIKSRVIAPVYPPTLRRIRERVGYARPDDVDIKLPAITDVAAQLRRWEEGKDQIGLTQAKDLARKYRVEVSDLYLEQLPPDLEQAPPNDFRHNDQRKPYTKNLCYAIREVYSRQNWLRAYLQTIGEGDSVLPKRVSSANHQVRDMAQFIRKWLGIGTPPETKGSKDAVFTKWKEAIDARHIMVFTNNSHNAYKIGSDEYDGLAIADHKAPVILLNPSSKISARRRLFTLMHELAHLFLNESAVSKISFRGEYVITNPVERRKEIWCNNVASEVLVPGEWLRSRWSPAHDIHDTKEQVKKIASKIQVSRQVIALKARAIELITSGQLNNLLKSYDEEYKRQQEMIAGQPSQSGGRLVPASAALKRCGHYFSHRVLDAYEDGFITAIKIYDLLGGLKLKYLKEFAERIDYPLSKWR